MMREEVELCKMSEEAGIEACKTRQYLFGQIVLLLNDAAKEHKLKSLISQEDLPTSQIPI